MKKTLVSWIGQTDLNAALRNETENLGPVAGALSARDFDRAVLLCNYPQERLKEYLPCLKEQCDEDLQIDARPVSLSNPTDYTEIYEVVTPLLQGLAKEADGCDDLVFHLSPGTPAMATVWILLASTKFPARLIQSSREQGVVDAQLPFDIAAEFVPDLVRRSKDIGDLAAATPPEGPGFDEIVHRSRVMREVLARAERAAKQNVPVLIEGESGTGKELLARAIFKASPRWADPFHAVNCGAIPEDLLESELFGHEKGAFTGAERAKVGLFEASTGGTLFLDEIGEMPLQAQVRLLRVLQEGKIVRLGSTREIEVDVRIITATNRNLIEETRAGRFRADLFYRLAVAVLRLPALREREGDLGLLVDHCLDDINRRHGANDRQWQARKLTPGARKVLMQQRWPGNVRELVNTLTRAVIWSVEPSISKAEITAAILPSIDLEAETILERPLGGDFDINTVIDEVKRHYLTRALEAAAGNKSKAAELIGVANYQTLTNWMGRLGIGES